MDNAIEAAKEVKENPEIRVLIKTRGVLYISVRNTVKDSEMENPFRHNYTTKEGSKVYGFSIITEEVEFAQKKSAEKPANKESDFSSVADEDQPFDGR